MAALHKREAAVRGAAPLQYMTLVKLYGVLYSQRCSQLAEQQRFLRVSAGSGAA
jgi:hypothetical protein